MPPKITKEFTKSTRTLRSSQNVKTRIYNSCTLCKAPDDEQMVQCDGLQCKKWFHFQCVGVNSDIEYHDWKCTTCQCQDLSFDASNTNHPSQPRDNAPKVTLIEDTREDVINRQGARKKNSHMSNKSPVSLSGSRNKDQLNSNKSVKSCADPIQYQNTESASGIRLKSTSGMSKSSRTSANRRFQLELQRLEEEHSIQEKLQERREQEREKMAKEFLDKKFEIYQALADEDEDESEISSDEFMSDEESFNTVEQWVSGTQLAQLTDEKMLLNRPDKIPDVVVKADKSSVPIQPSPCCLKQSKRDSANLLPCSNVHNSRAKNEPSSQQNSLMNRNSDHSCQLNNNVNSGLHQQDPQQITRRQLAARHVIKQELPNFNGNAEDWPMFISSFESSTATCAFSNDENLIRLQKSLKGNALEAVRCRLLLPSSVPDVIATLRMLFGRPEIIINAMLQKVRNEPPPKADKLETIIRFALSVQNMCSNMEATGMTAHLCNPLLLQELVDKLPAQLKLNWAVYKQALSVVTLSTFGNWLSQIAQAASEVTLTTISPFVPENRFDKKGPRDNNYVNVQQELNLTCSRNSSKICRVCNGTCLSAAECAKFLSLSHNERWNVVKQNSICRKCLLTHGRYPCQSREVCGIGGCTFKHNRLLHSEKKLVQNEIAVATEIVNVQQESSQVVFRVIPVILQGEKRTIKTFAFLDDGSSVTLIESELADELGLKRIAAPLCLKWTTNTHRREENSCKVSFGISGTMSAATKFRIQDAHTVETLNLPVQSINADNLKQNHVHLRKLPFASYENATPRILIGLRDWKLGIPLKVSEGAHNGLIAAKTRLGWTVYGTQMQKHVLYEKPSKNVLFSSYHICECDTSTKHDEFVHELFKDYFSIDSLGIMKCDKSIESDENQRARLLLESTSKFENNRYETGLLWRYDDVKLPNSYPMALKRLQCLENRMEREPDIKKLIQQQISHYIEKKYIRKLTKEEQQCTKPRSWFLPIFPVFNRNKPNKVRIVWDAAAKVEGISLNDMLLTGPDLLASLPGVLNRFREKKIAVCGDIREMFHQIRVKEDDQYSQKFLWRENSKCDPEVYVMEVMTFGATCSPSSAQFAKNKNALKFSDTHPKAVAAITENHYVDDWLESVSTEEEAIELAKSVISIHKNGGFEIRNWTSNSTEVLKALGEQPKKDRKSMNLNMSANAEKVLGMWWCTTSDSFLFMFGGDRLDSEYLTRNKRPTKREVLRTLMAIYDPLGLIAHYLIQIKILLQHVWRSKIEWDENLNDEQFERWQMWVRLLTQLDTIRIPRCYTENIELDYSNVQLHIFVDASENAFACVAYIRIDDGIKVECSLIGAKTRVAPLKLMSIPRLELQAALIGARYANALYKSHSIKFEKTVFWSDSRTVISWLQSDQRKYKQFVAFRVNEILELSDLKSWRWISSKNNVADEGTKWQKAFDINISSRWFNGPAFLAEPECRWPNSISTESLQDTEVELIHSQLHHREDIVLPMRTCLLDIKKYSKWQKLVRVNVYVRRFIYNVQAKFKNLKRRGKSITQEELKESERSLYQQAQLDKYSNEIITLKHVNNQRKRRIISERSSEIYKSNPILDENGTLRAGGRIDLVEGVGEYVKRPILLPRHHHVTELLVIYYHERYHHMNHETAVNEIRQVFSIPKLRVAVNSIKRNCQLCKIRDAKPNPPQMAQLPSARLATFTRPFTFIGIDYFGPMNVAIGRRTEKRWGVLITCLTTRAIHIEVAHTLSTSSCILSLRNFIARRGQPHTIYSDNGTNFHGTNNELKAVWRNVDRDSLMKEFTTSETKWVFNPPLAPHMGGSWERLVRSVKKILNQIKPSRNPSDELLNSMLIEIENTINSRPLSYLPIDDETNEALTPNHFLLGSSNGSKPVGEFTDDKEVLKKNWMTSQQLANAFWKRWIREYLPTLTRRAKWFDKVKPIEKGDIVVIVDENSPRNCWPKGRVLETVTGKVRQFWRATIQTVHGIYDRPAVKIAVLDVSGRSDEGKPTQMIVIPGGSVTKGTPETP